ncbi:hypothetical protein [Pseudomonas huanghezhanensis]|uniref:hypothetical protein n=1 Tax=Pseudomonas huanghezhanensis TaxID=3002903 RepID=UPI0022860038
MRYRRSSALKLMNVTWSALFCLALNVPGQVLAEDSVPEPALVFVQDHHLGESLGWLGYQVASRTVTFATIVDAVGRTQAQTLVQDELQSLQPRYQPEWDRNLAAAYAQSFTPEELKQLDVGEPAQPLANKFRTKQRDVGMDMKGRSSELLKVYVSTALDSALKKAKP